MAPPGAIRMDETSGPDWIALAGTCATRGGGAAVCSRDVARCGRASPSRSWAAPF